MALIDQEASSSNSSCSNSTRNWNFDIFLSFRGEDTRRSFTDHLYTTLYKKGFKVFRDDEELERGEIISEKLLQAIEDSRFAIVVVSKKYASSGWCLDELQHILASRKKFRQQVLPIFYQVDPSDVRHQRGSFAKAFAILEDKFQEDQQKLQQWRDSLTEVANLSGWDSKDWYEAELIEKVAEELWTKLRGSLPPNNDGLVGIDERVRQLESHLEIGFNDVRFVGIWGLGGVGKTTIAREVFKKFHSQFDICCFLTNVRTTSERDGEVHLQRKLLSHLKIRNMEIEDTYEGKRIIQNLCCNKKVLLVLDDVSSLIHLENLAESSNWFGVGSRVIVTTRDSHLLKAHGVHEVYEVETMPEDDSLQLFCQKAFRMDKPPEDFLELSKSVCDYAGGLPLALSVLGSFFCGRSVVQWEDALVRLKKDLNKDIFNVLRISYDALSDTEKAIFLDIACFFNHKKEKEIKQILESCGLHPEIGIMILIEKSLLKVSNDKYLDMHDLLYDKYLEMHDLLGQMGRSIVFEESPHDAGNRSRLWLKEDVDAVLLEKNMGIKIVQGVVSNTSYRACWDPKAFSSLCNLRLLIISRDVKLPYRLKSLSLPGALKVLHWKKYPLDTFPLGTQLAQLVDLKMCHSKVKRLRNISQCLESLKFLDLSHSENLIEIPEFYELPNLEVLELEGCVAVVDLHPSIGNHRKIQVLNLKGCKSLKALPRKLEMTSLKEFVLCGCIQVRNLPEFGEVMRNLVRLDARRTAITKLPNFSELPNLEKLELQDCVDLVELHTSPGRHKKLQVLNLEGCKNLKVLPRELEMPSLKEFILLGCNQVTNLPKFGETMKNLVTLDVGETSIIKLPESLGLLIGLKTLNLKGCKKLVCLPHNIHNLKYLEVLDICGCSKFSELPENLNENKALEELDASGTAITKLLNFSELPNLERLELQGCVDLVELHTSLERHKKLQVLNLKGCKNLKVLPRELEMTSLKEFILCGCHQVTNLPKFGETMKDLVTLDAGETSIIKLPESLGLLTGLKTLNLKGCKKLVCLPHNIHNLKYLEVLNICGCSKFAELPENLNKNKALEKLDASGTAITKLPSSIGLLEKLKTLSFHGCKRQMSNLLTLPTSILNLKSLKELDLSYCNIGDGFIPDDLGGLSSLERLDLSGNMFVNLPTGCISNLLELLGLHLNSCPRLQSLPQPSPRLRQIEGRGCASLETLSEEKLLRLFYSNGPPCRDYFVHYGVDVYGATIPGKEIPSFFENQEYLSLNEKMEASIIIDVPPHELFGFVLCTVLDDDLFYSAPSWWSAPCWHSGFVDIDNGRFEESQGRLLVVDKEIKSPNLSIIFGQIRYNSIGLAPIRSFKQLRLRFSAECVLRSKREVSIKCGWRVIRKSDIEKWDNSTSQGDFPLLGWHKSDFEKWGNSTSQSHHHLSGWHMNAGDSSPYRAVASTGDAWSRPEEAVDFLMENATGCDVEEEQEECSLSVIESESESCETIVKESDTNSTEPSSPCLQEDVTLDDSRMKFITDNTSYCDSAPPIAIADVTFPPSSSNCCECQTSERSTTQVIQSLVSLLVQCLLCFKTSISTSGEKIFEEVSQVPGLEQAELVQIYDIFTSDERKYESFKALPPPSRKPWILMQIKKYCS